MAASAAFMRTKRSSVSTKARPTGAPSPTTSNSALAWLTGNPARNLTCAAVADLRSTGLVVVEVQKAFDDEAYWGHRNNPACEANVAALRDTGPRRVAALARPRRDRGLRHHHR